MAVPFLDLAAQHASIQGEMEAAALEVLRSQSFILGPRVERFEHAMAKRIGVPHAVGVSSGSDALLMTLLAEDIGAGDEVVTSPFSFFATAGAIARVGAKPVFVDIEPESFNLDPAGLSRAIGERTRALIPVHLFGRMASMAPILDVGEQRHLVVIEDAAQAIGASSEAGRVGALGDYGCFSFFPSKNLGGAGDGGLISCRSEARAARLRRLRSHGALRPHWHEEMGGNFRLDALQAAILEVKLGQLDAWTETRRANAARYRSLFASAGLWSEAHAGARPHEERPLVLSSAVPGHVYNQFVVRAHRRDELARELARRNIGYSIYYPRPIHLQPAFSYLGLSPGSFPEAERAAAEAIALPIFPGLSEAQMEEVVGVIADFFAPR